MGNTNKRIMFVTNSLSGGGAERATNILVNSISNLGNEVCLVAINDGLPDLIQPECPVFEVKRRWKGGILSVLKAFLGLQKAIWKWKPSFLVLNCDIPEFLGSLTIGRHKLISVEHATTPWINRIRLGKFTRKVLTLRNTVWVAVSDHLSIWGTQSVPSISINNAIYIPQFDRAASKGQIKRINYIGRLSTEKQPIWALDVARGTNLPIRIFGDGLLRIELQDYALNSNIVADFEGYVPNPWTFFTESDLLIVPSLFEGDGLVVVEAIGNRIPLIVSDIYDLRRFQMKDVNYAESVDRFVEIIKDNSNRIENFLQTDEKISEILLDRNPIIVGTKWITFLDSIDQNPN